MAMTAAEIGTKLVKYCQEGKNLDSINTLYSDDIVSVEAFAPPGGGDRVAKASRPSAQNTRGGLKTTWCTAQRRTAPTRTAMTDSPFGSFTTSRKSRPAGAS